MLTIQQKLDSLNLEKANFETMLKEIEESNAKLLNEELEKKNAEFSSKLIEFESELNQKHSLKIEEINKEHDDSVTSIKTDLNLQIEQLIANSTQVRLFACLNNSGLYPALLKTSSTS